MKINDVRRSAFAMPLTNPAFPRGPYRFFDREYLIVTYRTDADALRAVVPEPLEFVEPIVKYEFIRMPDSTGFGSVGQISSLAIIAVTRWAIGLLIAALIVLALTNPSGAQMSRGVSTENTPSSGEQQDTNAALFVRCLQDWDTGTHMTKKEWSGACQRLLIERGNDPFPNSGNNFARTDK